MSFSLIVINFLWCRSETIVNYRVDMNTMSTEVFFNSGKLNKLFKVQVDVTLKNLKDQLDEIIQWLNHGDTRRVEDVWYERPSIDSVGRLTFTQMLLMNDNDVRRMFSVFCQHNMFLMIEMDASLLRLPKDILKSLFSKMKMF